MSKYIEIVKMCKRITCSNCNKQLWIYCGNINDQNNEHIVVIDNKKIIVIDNDEDRCRCNEKTTNTN